jgi:hypothetical protein
MLRCAVVAVVMFLIVREGAMGKARRHIHPAEHCSNLQVSLSTLMQVTALLQYIVNQLKIGESLDLVLLREIVLTMTVGECRVVCVWGPLVYVYELPY